MPQRNLICTGVTRARKLVVLVGSRRALAVAVRTKGPGRRHTALGCRLRSAASLPAEVINGPFHPGVLILRTGAQRAGMTQPALSRLKRGGGIPTITVLDRIANALQATLTVSMTRAA